MSKKDKIKTFIAKGEISKAASVARTFFFGLSKDEKESIEIAADASDSKKVAFYNQIGVDIELHLAMAGAILHSKFC